MARPYRLQAENCLYHITSRGDDRKKIYVNDYDYNKFLEYLSTAKEKYKFYLYAYCLMGNHYHLLLETTQANISRIMQYLNTSYTVYYNVKHKKCGHLFQGRYKSIIVEADSYLLELTRYIHLNPVRAKIVDSPEKYTWSSYHDYIKTHKKGIIDKTQVNRYFTLAAYDYKKFVLEGIGKVLTPFKDIYAGFILGREKFIKDNLAILKNQVESKDFAYKKLFQGVEPRQIIQKVATYYGKEPEVLCNARKKPLLAKKIAVYLLKKLTALTNKEIGDTFNIGYSGVSWIAKDMERLIIEDERVKKDSEALNSQLKV
jgi:REP element-mobilizing transposase RayT